MTTLSSVGLALVTFLLGGIVVVAFVIAYLMYVERAGRRRNRRWTR